LSAFYGSQQEDCFHLHGSQTLTQQEQAKKDKAEAAVDQKKDKAEAAVHQKRLVEEEVKVEAKVS
jgi:hypothetical protein